MKIRRLALPRGASFFIALLLVLVIVSVLLRLIVSSLDERSAFKRYFDNNLITNLGCSAIAGLIAAVFSLRKGILLPRFVFGDDRQTFTPKELSEKFELDGTLSPTAEAGWKAMGKGMHHESVATYKSKVDQLFSIAAQFKPLRKQQANSHWRTGFIFKRSNGAEAVIVHIDSHNCLIGYLDGKLSLRFPLSTPLEGKWSLLTVNFSVLEPPNFVHVFCHLDGQSWPLGTVPATHFPWSVQIKTWSDECKHHVVLMRDISVSYALRS